MTRVRTNTFDVYKVLVTSTEPKFVPWTVSIAASSSKQAVATARRLLDERRKFDLRVVER